MPAKSFLDYLRFSKKDKAPKDDGLTAEERKRRRIYMIRLLVALTIPVFLETLDYTGEGTTCLGGFKPEYLTLPLQSWLPHSRILQYVAI